MVLLFGLLVGLGMGVLLQRVGATSPALIARNLRLENLSIIKFMALTIAVGTVVTYALALFIPMHLDVKPLYLVGVLVGGLIFGVGFAVGGYCPGTCLVGAGEGRRDALFAAVGGIVGALAYTLIYPSLRPLLAVGDFGKVTLAGVIGVPHLVGSLALAAVLVGVIWYVPTVRRTNGSRRA